jgi:hypothetical protein
VKLGVADTAMAGDACVNVWAATCGRPVVVVVDGFVVGGSVVVA